MASTALCSPPLGHLGSSRSSNTRTSSSSRAAHSLGLPRPQPCSSRPRGAATQAHSSLVSYQHQQQQHSSTQLCRAPHTRGRQPTPARRKLAWSALSPAMAAAGADGGSGGSAGMLPSSAPKGPQRAATQRGSSGSAAPPPPASAAAAAAPYTVTMQQEHEHEQQHQQQHHSVVMQQESISMSQTHVWLPDQQLWLPHPAAAVAHPSNPLSRPHSGSTPSLARVFMGSSAVRPELQQDVVACGACACMHTLHHPSHAHVQTGLARKTRNSVPVCQPCATASDPDATSFCCPCMPHTTDGGPQGKDGGPARAGSAAPRARRRTWPGRSDAPAGRVLGRRV